MAQPLLPIADAVPLAPLTTLELGGTARHLVEAQSPAMVVAAVAWAEARGLPLLVLGGGSNVVISDSGFSGLVVRMATRGVRFALEDGQGVVQAAAGESWDGLVSQVVARGWAGLECLAGIPGLVGATPIQNVGAYGQEVAETIRAVTVLERATGRFFTMQARDCGFSYRQSRFKRQPDDFVVLEVTFALSPGGAPRVRYAELGAALAGKLGDDVAGGGGGGGLPGAGHRPPTLGEVSETVRTLRRRKSMLLDPADPNRRSVGSFFTNPVLPRDIAAAVVARALASGAAASSSEVPQFPTENGLVKLSAGWLIERAGFSKGFRRDGVGLSTNHALALVHHGGGTTAQLLALAGRSSRRSAVGLASVWSESRC